MHFIKTYFLTFLMTVFALTSCASQNSNNPIVPDSLTKNLSYTVKTNGTSEISIRYIDDKNELQEIGIPLPGGIQVFEFEFETPGDVHYISASVPETDSTHNLLFVSTEDFTTNGKNFVEISY